MVGDPGWTLSLFVERIAMNKPLAFLFLVVMVLLSAMTCIAQMYSVTDLGLLSPTGINSSTQIVGNLNGHAQLWSQAGGLQDLGTIPGGTFSIAVAINDLGIVAGTADGPGTMFAHGSDPNGQYTHECADLVQPFLWKPDNGMRGLGTVNVNFAYDCRFSIPFLATAINALSEVVGYYSPYGSQQAGFDWTATNGMQTIGLGDWIPTIANAITNSGQIAGQASTYQLYRKGHAVLFSVIGGGTDLGTLGGGADVLDYASAANAINELGKIVGWSTIGAVDLTTYPETTSPVHAVLWTVSAGIRDLGTLPGDISSAATKINFFGQAIGSSGNAVYADRVSAVNPPFVLPGRPFIWSDSGGIKDLNALISSDSGWVLNSATDINMDGKIVGLGTFNGESHGFLLTPVYTAFVQHPMRGNGGSVFSAKRGVVPVKFVLTNNGKSTCSLPPATIAVARLAGANLGLIDEIDYFTNTDNGSNFRIDQSACQYVYNLAAPSLGAGTYQVDININGIMVGHAVFALK